MFDLLNPVEVLNTRYYIHVSLDMFNIIAKWDKETRGANLGILLNNIVGVFETEYSRRFDAGVAFSIKQKYDTPETWEKIRTAIEEYVATGKRILDTL